MVILTAPASVFAHFSTVTPIHIMLRAHLFWAFLALFVVIVTSLVDRSGVHDPMESQRLVIGGLDGIGSVPSHDAQH